MSTVKPFPPLTVKSGRNLDTYELYGSNCEWGTFYDKEQATYAANAINSHEIIKRLEGDIKHLSKTLDQTTHELDVAVEIIESSGIDFDEAYEQFTWEGD